MRIKDLRARANEIKTNVSVLYLALKHPQTPWYTKALIAVVVSYAFSPIDLIPDFIPVLGYLDDLLLIPAGIALAIRLIPADVIQACRAQVKESSINKKIGIYAGIIIIAAWSLVAVFLYLKFF